MTKKMDTIKFDHKREYEWLIISQSYFQCALISARILSEEVGKFGISNNSPLKRIYGNYPQSPEYLIFPILYNFKHGIEIYLKAIIGISNSEFPKEHNLTDLLNRSGIKDDAVKDIIQKYAYAQWLLPANKKIDCKNIFERYPQGSPYDALELFTVIDKIGQILPSPPMKSFESFTIWIKQNNANVIPAVNQEKIQELIDDIEFIYKRIREVSLS